MISNEPFSKLSELGLSPNLLKMLVMVGLELCSFIHTFQNFTLPIVKTMSCHIYSKRERRVKHYKYQSLDVLRCRIHRTTFQVAHKSRRKM